MFDNISKRLRVRRNYFATLVLGGLGDLMVRTLARGAVRVQALAVDIVLCSWARHFKLRDKLRPDGPLGSYAHLTLTLTSYFQLSSLYLEMWPNAVFRV